MVEQALRGAEGEKRRWGTWFAMMGKGPQLVGSSGNAWTSNWIRCTLNGNLPSTSINEISGSTTIAAAMRTSAFKV
jgi:hypothetical protein